MAKKGKKYTEALNQIEKGKAYTKEEAVELVKKVSTSKFDGSVEVAIKLNLDIASEFLLMASTLVLIKSRGLLPKTVEDEAELTEEELFKRAKRHRKDMYIGNFLYGDDIGTMISLFYRMLFF